METSQYLQRQRELLDRLSLVNSEDFKTKKEIIGSLIDATRPLIKSGYYVWKPKYFASFIYQQLEEYNIEYPRGETFYSLFHENEKQLEKGTNNMSPEVTHVHKFIDDECDCGKIKHKGILYDVAPDITLDTTDLEKNTTKEEKPDPYSNKTTEYLQRVKYNCDELGSICSDVIKKYYDDEEIAKVIEKSIPNVSKLLEEQKGTEAKLIHMGKQSDYRQKIGEFEKVKSIILCKSEYNLAKVAKILTITPKHQSKNILQNIDKFITNMKWFRAIFFECNKCKYENEIEIFDWYNHQIERKTLGLEQIDPT